jgi:hypothetical protein
VSEIIPIKIIPLVLLHESGFWKDSLKILRKIKNSFADFARMIKMGQLDGQRKFGQYQQTPGSF